MLITLGWVKNSENIEGDFTVNLKPSENERLRKINYAIEFFKRAIKDDPRNCILWSNMGVQYYNLNDFKKSIDCFIKAVKIDICNYMSWLLMGETYMANTEYKLAIDCFQLTLEQKPNNFLQFRTMYNIALSSSYLGDYQTAIKYIKRALKVDPKIGSWSSKNALLEMKEDWVERSLENLRCDILQLMAIAYGELGNDEKKFECITKIEEVDPHYKMIEELQKLKLEIERKPKRQVADFTQPSLVTSSLGSDFERYTRHRIPNPLENVESFSSTIITKNPCHIKGCYQNPLMPFTCKFCGRKFCSSHRLPENHNCIGDKIETPPLPERHSYTEKQIELHRLYENSKSRGSNIKEIFIHKYCRGCGLNISSCQDRKNCPNCRTPIRTELNGKKNIKKRI